MTGSSYVGVVCLKDANGNKYYAQANLSSIESRLTTLENRQSLAVQTISFSTSDWTQNGTVYEMGVTGCNHVLKIYKIVNSQRVEVPGVSAIRTGTQAFTLRTITTFTGELLVS